MLQEITQLWPLVIRCFDANHIHVLTLTDVLPCMCLRGLIAELAEFCSAYIIIFDCQITTASGWHQLGVYFVCVSRRLDLKSQPAGVAFLEGTRKNCARVRHHESRRKILDTPGTVRYSCSFRCATPLPIVRSIPVNVRCSLAVWPMQSCSGCFTYYTAHKH